MTDTATPARPHTTGVGTPEQIRSVLDDIARDLRTLRQIEKIQQQHQVVLASTEVVAAHLRAGIETLQQTLAQYGCDTTPITRARAPEM
ncbi:hypothetical protein [Nocardia jiangxiensis]|uniref:hypothetical protein n=1 Tax=Nocardia jiangxiensis TaxID=282685 RepID=UPI000307DBC5|nr:hypothetical protein [Nocardia jiangxiensis]